VADDVEVGDLSVPSRMSRAPALDAVVVTYQNADTIGHCVSRLQEIPGLSRVVVVDHGTDGSAEVARVLGATVVRNPTNPGFGAGQNQGRALTTAPYVLICNPDADVVPEAIAHGVAMLAGQPDVAALQGDIEELDRDLSQRSSWQSVGPLHLWARIFRLGSLIRTRPLRALSQRLRLIPRAPSATHDVEALATIVALVRRDAIEAVDGFDEGYFMYWEDLDLSKRLRDAGWRLRVTPEVWAVHAGGASNSDPFGRERLWWQGCLRYAARWYPRPQWLAARAAAAAQWLMMSVQRPHESHSLWTELVTSPQHLRRRRMSSDLRAPVIRPESTDHERDRSNQQCRGDQ